MGIEASYRRVPPDKFKQLIRQQAYFEAFIYERYANAELSRTYQFLDIDKNWQAIHFLLTGEVTFTGQSKIDSPLAQVVMGGKNTPYEATYDYYRYLEPDDVKRIAKALGDLSLDEIRANNERKHVEELYASDSPDEWDDETWEFMLDLIRQLVVFFNEAASAGDVIILSSD